MADLLFNKVTGTISGTSYGGNWAGNLGTETTWRKVATLNNGVATPLWKNSEPFWIEPEQEGLTIHFTKASGITASNIYIYTKNNGTYTYVTNISTNGGGYDVASGTRIYLIKSGSNNLATASTDNYTTLTFSGNNGHVGGDIRSLCQNSTTLSTSNITDMSVVANYHAQTAAIYASRLFYGNTYLTDASQLELSPNIGNYSYCMMFNGCTRLTYPPIELPATTAKSYCYYKMFYGCSSLAKSPIIYLTATGVSNCMREMFSTCSNMTALYLKASALENTSNSITSAFTGVNSNILVYSPGATVTGGGGLGTLPDSRRLDINAVYPY